MASSEDVMELMDACLSDMEDLRIASHKTPSCTFSENDLDTIEEAIGSLNERFGVLVVDPNKQEDVDKQVNVKKEFLDLSKQVEYVLKDAKNFTGGRRDFVDAAERFAVFPAFVSQHENDEIDAATLKTRQKRLNECFDKIEREHRSFMINLEDKAQRRFQNDHLAAIEEDFSNISIWFERKLIAKETPVVSASQAPPSASHASHHRVKLPQVELPKYDGKPDGWIQFRDSFKALIHDETSLSSAIKFRYLKECITDKLSPIAQLPESAEGYADAWKLVCDQYEDPRRITAAHFNQILATKKMNAESYEDIQRLYNETLSNVNAVSKLMNKDELFDAFVAHLTLSKLDHHSRELYENDYSACIPSWCHLKEFLDKRRKALSAMPVAKGSIKTEQKAPTQPARSFSKPVNSFVANQSDAKCPMCSMSHWLNQCDAFKALDIPQRSGKVKDFKLCYNCFGAHEIKNCTSKFTCRHCDKKHHSLLHKEDKNPVNTETRQVQLNQEAPEFVSSAHSYSTKSAGESTVMLSTALIDVQDSVGDWHALRVLLDSGSDANFMTVRAADVLRLKTTPVNIKTKGFGGKEQHISKSLKAKFKSRTDRDFESTLEFLINRSICQLATPTHLKCAQLQIPPELSLADPNFHQPGHIDMLIGNEMFQDLMLSDKIKLPSGPTLRRTPFGWIIAGKTALAETNQSVRCHVNTIGQLTHQMEKFYKLEDYKIDRRFFTADEEHCEQLFEQTHQRKLDGRFVIEIPVKQNVGQLANNRGQAHAQLIANEKRLSLEKHHPLRDEYRKFLNEYEALGHMTEIDGATESQSRGYYMPHHAVLKPDSNTTKVRVVFNASAKTQSGLSFNDVQHVGPTIQSDIFTMNLKFRQHAVVIKGDLKQMYRQIEVQLHQRHLQQIVWRERPEENVKTFRLNTVTYGTACAMYQATRCIKQLAIDNRENYPEASAELEAGMYVDDLISGAANSNDAIRLHQQIKGILDSAQMPLRKIASNSTKFLDAIPVEDREVPSEKDATIKTLGIKWNPITDQLQFDFQPVDISKITRRTVLSAIAKLYDPEGLLGPVTFLLKKFMKAVWLLNQPWDDDLPEEEAQYWRELAGTLTTLNDIRIDRQAFLSTYITIQLHGFSDASDHGYGSAIYIRTEDSYQRRMSQLMSAKSRIAPTERRSTARLELCGAELNVELMIKTEAAFKVQFHKKVAWTDSAICLHWLRKSPSQLQPFVANRVSNIQERSSDISWRHVRGEVNPADLISRGLMPSELVDNAMWFHGADFLLKPEEEWPESMITVEPEDEPAYKNEFKKVHTALNIQRKSCDHSPFFHLIDKVFSSTDKIIKSFAVIFRFARNCKMGKGKVQLEAKLRFTTQELLQAENAIIRLHQKAHFGSEYKALEAGVGIDNKSSIKSLHPILKDSIMCVGGRISNASHISDAQKHQILMPKCRFIELIVRETHRRNLHSGVQATHGYVKMKYWPLRVKDTIKKEIQNCVRCCRAHPRLVQQFMGQLPEARITPAPPFHRTGVDYAGPFEAKSGPARNARSMKVYICVFVCLATKAIHLELVSDLTTKGFLAAFDRFTARRGLSIEIKSDHGTNFVGASNELDELRKFLEDPTTQEEIRQHFLKQRIDWHFIPPRAPQHGGLWEAAVKSVKSHLRHALGSSLLTFEEMYTVTCRIEAMLNSRPLVPLSDDPNDCEALTAGHILIGRPLIAPPRHDYSNDKRHMLHRWDRVAQITQDFWKRWNRDYLHLRQIRTKNYKEEIPIKIGQLIIMHVDNQPALSWPMGRIIKVTPGKDGITRVVKIRTQSGEYDRPVSKISMLPIRCHEEDENEAQVLSPSPAC